MSDHQPAEPEGACPEASLFQLVYSSRARVSPSEAHFREMCAVFADRNSVHAISGVFLCMGDRFVQVLEGNRSDVLQLTANIRRDVRHTDFQPLLQRDIATRAFGEWTMGGLYFGAEVHLAGAERERLRGLIRDAVNHPNDRVFWREALRRLPALLRPQRGEPSSLLISASGSAPASPRLGARAT